MRSSLGTPHDFAVVFDRHFASIYRYLARRMSSLDADDVAAEVFRVAFEQRARFDTERESALPWLYGIASNLLSKHRRRAARGFTAIARASSRALGDRDVDAFAAIDDRLDAARSRQAALSALRSLSAIDRELVLLAAFTEMSYRELAEATDLAEGTVKSKLSRAKSKLRELLAVDGQQQVQPPTSHALGEQT